MEMRMLPSNGFTYNFNGPSLNTFGQLSVNPYLDTSPMDNGQSEHASHLDDHQHNQLYELNPHHQQTNSYSNQTGLADSSPSSKGEPVISLFKLKNSLNHYLNQPKKPMQSMFSTGQELASSGLQLLSSDNNSMINHETNHSSLQTTSAPFYNNLAPSAIGTSAIVSAPMLLSQSSEQVSIDSIRNSSITSTNNQLINFESNNLRLPIHNHNHSQSSSINSTTHHARPSNTSRYLSHTSKETPLKKFICKYCGETFQSKGEMQIHTTAHHREAKPYKCPFDKCTKRFQKTNYLKQHQRIHTNETPFTCHMCQRKFKQQSHLKQHIRTHTGAKPYKCKYSDCDNSFSQESNLRSHMRSHESGRPFKCNSCHLTFEDEPSLLAHIPKHRETKHTKIHICDYCGKSYSIELYLSKHVQHKHADKMNLKTLASSSSAIASTLTNQSPTVTTTRSKSKSLNATHHLGSGGKSSEQSEHHSPSNSPSSTSSSIKSNQQLNNSLNNHSKSKKTRSSPNSSSSAANFLPSSLMQQHSPQQAPPQQHQSSTPAHINYSTSNNQHHLAWANKSNAGSSSPDSVNSNCMSSSTNSEMINLSSNGLAGIGQLTSQTDQMFSDLNSSLPTRYDLTPSALEQSAGMFYNHHHAANTMSSASANQHQSAFTALGRANQNSPKYFTSNTCESGFTFNKPSQYSSISANNSNQLHSSAVAAAAAQQHSQQQQQLSQHASQESQMQLQSNGQAMHQLSPLTNSHLAQQHLQHTSASQHQTNQQLISLNQIRNYACMPNQSTTTIHTLQPSGNPYEYPIMILQ